MTHRLRLLALSSIAATLFILGCHSTPVSTERLARSRRPATQVTLGIDALERDGFKPLKGKRIALITNHTGLNSKGQRVVDVLHRAPDVKLVKLFSPEHGLYGKKDEKVGDETDAATGLKVFSLYGKTRKPTTQMIQDVDAVVFDIQDIGTRYYTYISTMGLAMEACKEHGKEMVVLDRPNPITGLIVDGPVADDKHLGFTAFRPMPVTHGMTAGELATMFNKQYGGAEGRGIDCKLTVVKMRGWKREMWWEDTGARWVNPSPNMKSPTGALLYPAVGLLEASNLSVGRGTELPFEIFGAPWIDARELARALNAHHLPGLRFQPYEFTANYEFDRQRDTRCAGVRVLVTDRNKVRPVLTGVVIAHTLRTLYPNAFNWRKVANLLQNDAVAAQIWNLKDPTTAADLWAADLAQFESARGKYLLYEP